jgi:hypothetical protein
VVVPSHILPSRKGERGDTAVVDTFLTLVIAVGGIVTGIGAIWAAMLARRQAQISERQAQLTERSLNEQNERLRLNLEVDLLHRMQDRYDSRYFIVSQPDSRHGGRLPPSNGEKEASRESP